MFYYLFYYLQEQYNFTGAGVFEYLSFRAALAVITSLIITMVIGKRVINYLRKLQVGETIRDLGLEGQMEKEGTPTMGGLIILAAIFIPTLLFAKLHNIYIILMLICITWMGSIGFIDDYVKVFKKDKKGLAAKFKILGQIGLGIILGTTLFFHEDVVVRREATNIVAQQVVTDTDGLIEKSESENIRLPITTIPFVKSHEFNYSDLLGFLGDGHEKWAFLIFIPLVILIVAAVSNGTNMSDGLDGLATGSSAIVVATLGVFAWVSGNMIFSDYLNIMYIPNSGELVVFSAAFIGGCVGFLWYNAYPAQVFMGDTGSLAIGGIIAALAVMIRKELLIPVLCGIFLIENVSVMVQVGYFKYTKRHSGIGKRMFLMAPLHHHYQKLGFHESKIVSRFWIVGIMLAVLTIVTLKLR